MHTIAIVDDGTYIQVTVTGPIDPVRALAINQEAHAEGMARGIHRYLVDLRQSRNVATVARNFYFIYDDMKPSPVLDPRARIAALVAPDDHSHDVIETLAINTGHYLRIFRDLDAALAFLRQ